ncbi:MAG: hypothetical protein HPY62_06860 [Bacteroidales bacterium]|nr:hypothetical protein [Bacteroidales bacterium]
MNPCPVEGQLLFMERKLPEKKGLFHDEDNSRKFAEGRKFKELMREYYPGC